MTVMSGPRKRLIPLVALGALLVPVAVTVAASPAQATGNNGTIKVHALGSDEETPSNEPKVCAFNLEFFGFDEGTDGYVTFDVQGGDGPTGVAAGPFDEGPANADGYFESEYFNVEAGPVIQNGHYKVTLFGKFNDGRPNYEDVKAKSKVFKVDCQPTEEPPPPTTCPEGTTPTDTDGDGVIESGECGPSTPPVVVPPVVTPPVVTPPVVTPPVVNPPVVTPPEAPKVVKLKAKVTCECVTKKFGEALVKIKSLKKSTKAARVKIRVNGKVVRTVKMRPGKTVRVHLTGLKTGSVVKVTAQGKKLAKGKVRAAKCKTPTRPPNTGLRISPRDNFV